MRVVASAASIAALFVSFGSGPAAACYGCQGGYYPVGAVVQSGPPAIVTSPTVVAPQTYQTAPIYQAPVYQAPIVQTAPVYQAPVVQAAPIYQAPIVQTPVIETAPTYVDNSTTYINGGRYYG